MPTTDPDDSAAVEGTEDNPSAAEYAEDAEAELAEGAAAPPDPEAAGTEVARVASDGTLLDVPAAALADPGPDPITPGSSQEAYHNRVAYENLVNTQLEHWLEQNRGAILDTFLAGGTVELNHSRPDADEEELGLPVEVEVDRPYSDWTNAELSEECANRGLAKSGTNAELIERLEADDKQDGVEVVPKS